MVWDTLTFVWRHCNDSYYHRTCSWYMMHQAIMMVSLASIPDITTWISIAVMQGIHGAIKSLRAVSPLTGHRWNDIALCALYHETSVNELICVLNKHWWTEDYRVTWYTASNELFYCEVTGGGFMHRYRDRHTYRYIYTYICRYRCKYRGMDDSYRLQRRLCLPHKYTVLNSSSYFTWNL